jgi:hypothetical protein
MNHSILLLLFAFAASPAVLADQASPIPDMSPALQSRIDSAVAATLDGRTHGRPEPAARHSTGTGTQRSAGSGSGGTDEPGWKPYHSAM